MEYLKHRMKNKMSLILDVRYTDLERERALCEELLEWAEEHEDDYAKAFAQIHLGDYALAVCDEETAGRLLLEAEGLLKGHPEWEFLSLQIYRFLGIYHDIRMDEQGAVNSYLKAITAAEKLGDGLSQSVVLNNLASIFSKHKCEKEARDYFVKACQLAAPFPKNPYGPLLHMNLSEVCLRMGEHEEAKQAIEACARAEQEMGFSDAMSSWGWCSYYATAGDWEKAVYYAERLLQYRKQIDADKLTAFDYYYNICDKMLQLGNEHYAGEFLRMMEATSSASSLERMKRLEGIRTRYILQFGSEEERDEAYHHFYLRSQQFRKQAMEITLEAMQSKIYLDELIQQTTKMKSEQQSLTHEVEHDGLTGLYNRRFLEARMRAHTDSAEQGTLNVIILDVDYFKEYNDCYGHLKGDNVLQQIADCLQSSKREGIYPCRYGGDEFVCLCENLSAEATEAYIHAVRDGLQAKAIPHVKSPCSGIVTLSIGYADEAAGLQEEGHLLLQRADQALYESKRNGRNTFTRNKASL